MLGTVESYHVRAMYTHMAPLLVRSTKHYFIHFEPVSIVGYPFISFSPVPGSYLTGESGVTLSSYLFLDCPGCLTSRYVFPPSRPSGSGIPTDQRRTPVWPSCPQFLHVGPQQDTTQQAAQPSSPPCEGAWMRPRCRPSPRARSTTIGKVSETVGGTYEEEIDGFMLVERMVRFGVADRYNERITSTNIKLPDSTGLCGGGKNTPRREDTKTWRSTLCRLGTMSGTGYANLRLYKFTL